MLQAGIIRKSSSPWSAPCIIVPKKNGEKRPCVDFRKLNALTEKDVFPIPRLDDIFDHLSSSTIFSTLDLKSGYWQIPMHANSIAKTAFSTGDGHFEFVKLPFGLRNAPAVFSFLVTCLLSKFTLMTLPSIQRRLMSTLVISKKS